MITRMPILNTNQNNNVHQQGVVLIMVLGLLSVMILMAVSFAVAMRTERLAAGNSLDSVKANQLVRTALHLAMADIYQRLHMVERETCTVDIANSQIIVSNAAVYPTGCQIALNNMIWQNYPIYSIYRSPTTIQIASSSNDAMAGNNLDLTKEYGLLYNNIIKRLANPAGYPYPPWEAITSHSTNSMQRCQISLTNDALKYIPACLISAVTNVDSVAGSNYWINIEASVNGKTTTVGRVAYLIANCSGLLDANYVGGSNRADGTHPAEIAIEYLTEIGADKPSLINYRTANGSFEILPKLAAWKPSWHPSNMFCYSASLENEWRQSWLDVKGKVDISGGITNLTDPAKRNAIITAFWASGLTNAGEAEAAYTNLIDYVDSDSLPLDLHTSVEAVPLINEIMLSNTVTIVGSSNYYLVNNIVVELSYPFSFNNTTPFDIELNATFTPDHPSYPSFTLPPISMSSTATCSAASFKILTFTSTNNVVLQALQPPPSELKWKETITKATVKWSGQTVDQMDNSLSCTVTSSLPLGPTYFVSTMDKECIDPRFNWDTDSTNQWNSWSVSQSSVGDVNLITKSYWLSHPGCDSTMSMEVNNRPLQSLNELDYLIYSTQAWTTIDLAKHNVLDNFCLGVPVVDRGFVNPNTHIRDVLAATFYNVQSYTNGVGVTTADDAEKIADAIINGKGIYGYKTLSEVQSVIYGSTNIPTYIDKNVLVAKTEKLLNLRQNLFVIIIEVHVASGGNIPSKPARQRAAAIVWRDPFRENFYVRSLIFF